MWGLFASLFDTFFLLKRTSPFTKLPGMLALYINWKSVVFSAWYFLQPSETFFKAHLRLGTIVWFPSQYVYARERQHLRQPLRNSNSVDLPTARRMFAQLMEILSDLSAPMIETRRWPAPPPGTQATKNSPRPSCSARKNSLARATPS